VGATSQSRIEEVLCPGLATELYHHLWQLPLSAGQFDEQGLRGVAWRCSFQVPPEADPQHAEAFYRIRRFLDQDLLELAPRAQRWARARPSDIDLVVLRKGSFLEFTPPSVDHLGFFLSLTVGSWPMDWGGVIQTETDSMPTGWNRLHLFAGKARIPVLERHVEIMAIHGWLMPRP
jgi:hypothetical protein